jgi:catechol 2,3-dioxygenase-like lactoylglutathione lyase family enzyme
MVKTHGLSHVALSVRDPDRSLAFYNSVFGVREYFRAESAVQVLGPGQYDVLAFEKCPVDAGATGASFTSGFGSPGQKTLTPPLQPSKTPGQRHLSRRLKRASLDKL